MFLKYPLSNREETFGLVLKKHVVVRSKTNASTKNVLNTFTLTCKSIDNRSTSRNHRTFKKVAKDRKDGSETFRLLHFLGLVSDTSHELSKDDKIGHERSSKKGILTSVVDSDGVDTTHEDFGSVLIHSTLAITNIRDVLDDDAVVGLLTRLVEETVALDDIIDDTCLCDFLGTELCRRAEVLAIVVAKVIVRDDGGDLETSTNEEVSEDALDLGLTTLEIVTSDVDTVTLGKFDDTGDEGVLRRAVDETALLEDGSDSKHSRRSDLLLVAVNGSKKLISGGVQTSTDISKALGGGSPKDDDLLELVLLLEVANVGADLFNELLVRHGARQHVISTILLIGSDEIREIDGAKRLHLGHDRDELALEVNREP